MRPFLKIAKKGKSLHCNWSLPPFLYHHFLFPMGRRKKRNARLFPPHLPRGPPPPPPIPETACILSEFLFFKISRIFPVFLSGGHCGQRGEGEGLLLAFRRSRGFYIHRSKSSRFFRFVTITLLIDMKFAIICIEVFLHR